MLIKFRKLEVIDEMKKLFESITSQMKHQMKYELKNIAASIEEIKRNITTGQEAI